MSTSTITQPVIPRSVFLALDRMARPGSRMILLDQQIYIISGQVPLAAQVPSKVFDILRYNLEWISAPEQTDIGKECKLTETGRKLIKQREAARIAARAGIANLEQSEIDWKVPRKEKAHV